MPKFNVDEQYAKTFESIILVIDGTEYSVDKIEANVLESMMGNVDNPKGLREGFASLVGKDKKTFQKTDFRKLALAMRNINEEMRAQLEKFQSKNASGEDVTPTQ